MKIIATSLIATTALLSLLACSGTPLDGRTGTKNEDSMDEIARFVQEDSIGRRLVQDEESGVVVIQPRYLRTHSSRSGRGSGGTKGKKNKCKVDKKDGSVEGDCTLLDILTARKKEFSIYLEAAEKAKIIDQFDDVISDSGATLFVPTNAAFEAAADAFTKYLDTDIWGTTYVEVLVDYHLNGDEFILSSDFVEGQLVLIDDEEAVVPSPVRVDLGSMPPQLTGPFIASQTNIVEVDHVATNGVMHVIDQALTSFFMGVNILQAAGLRPQDTSKFAELIALANLNSLFEGPGPLHVFVIPNAVFDAAGPLFDGLKALPTEQLAAFMLNHIIDGLLVQDFCDPNTQTFQSMAGNDLVVVDDGTLSRTVNGVPIVPDSFFVANGQINFIGGVLQPPPAP